MHYASASAFALSVLLAAAAAGADTALAQRSEASQTGNARTTRTDCANPNAIGVSRVIEIDTTGGPHFGQQQYKTEDPLRDREVVLTFDDGPLRRHTQTVLAALEAHCTKATFFAVGRMAIADADMLRRVADAGHTIGHHTWSHKNQQRNNLQTTIAEFELGVSAVDLAIGRPSAPFFRFPYLADPDRMKAYVSQRDFGIFSIDIDSNDWRTKAPERVHATVMAQLRLKGKGIVLFHDIQPSTAGSIRRLLDDMRDAGYKIVHIVSKAPTVTLPEYDEEAAILLENRSWTRNARPLKTAFKFDGGALPATSETVVRTRSEAASDRPQALPPAARPTTSPSPAAQEPSLPPPPSSSAFQTPSWRDDVFGGR
ncbi:MAG: polysaccharide deacetylase family protein [Hyphomicrobiaceae bacterium]